MLQLSSHAGDKWQLVGESVSSLVFIASCQNKATESRSSEHKLNYKYHLKQTN